MFKQNDKVRFGDMTGMVLTTSAPKAGFPIQVVFAKQKLVVGFRADGYFFEFGAGPKLTKIKENIFKKGLKYVTNMLRPKGQVDSDKPHS